MRFFSAIPNRAVEVDGDDIRRLCYEVYGQLSEDERLALERAAESLRAGVRARSNRVNGHPAQIGPQSALELAMILGLFLADNAKRPPWSYAADDFDIRRVKLY